MPLLPLHQAHDPRTLLARWRVVARQTGLKVRVLTELAGEKILYLESPSRSSDTAFDYLSTGVHGDEAGAAWGLLTWAENHLAELSRGTFLIFPCLNPHGLRANTRVDHRGFDINRRFHMDDDDLCGPWRRIIAQRKLRFGLCLHEDYDAQGCYVYELSPHSRPLSASLLNESDLSIPPDPRRRIDGRTAKAGIIRPRRIPADLPGMPEAVELFHLGCATTLTFETPSEFSFDDRVQTQATFVAAALRQAA